MHARDVVRSHVGHRVYEANEKRGYVSRIASKVDSHRASSASVFCILFVACMVSLVGRFVGIFERAKHDLSLRE